ncbi:hypothetical protein NDU88_003857 [Pleurodeles waltl]|uniref:Uncharacterized protein n=1 Tax=Pleurodeles waltl TaxID=8319 RepID=A0AAV7MRT4_PLEWA|nr:hypothetical protein NDU88_003857 [Pleurodeles waltl]
MGGRVPGGGALSAWGHLRPLTIRGQVSGCTPAWRGKGEERTVPALGTPSRSPLGPGAVSHDPCVQEGGRKGDVAVRLRQARRTSPRSPVSGPYAVVPNHRGGPSFPARGPHTERRGLGHNPKASFSSAPRTVGREGERCAAVGKRRPRKSAPM